MAKLFILVACSCMLLATSQAVSLAAADAQNVQNSWNQAVTAFGGVNQLGLAFFKALFTAHPEYAALFSSIGNSQPPAAFEARANIMGASLNNLIQTLGNEANEGPLLVKLGHQHHSIPITRAHFEEWLKSLLPLLEGKLGDSVMTPAVKASWNNAWKHITDDVISNMHN